MYYDLLAHFIEQSSDWSSLKRGMEVFQRASQLFEELFQVDSGFFVYKKRIPSDELEPLQIYHPWGKYEGAGGSLQTVLDSQRTLLKSYLETNSEKWVDGQDIPFDITPEMPQLGIWKLTSRGEMIGAIVLARSVPKSADDEHVISICAKQISLILDMFLAWRTAEEVSRYDSLTGVLNRRGIYEIYETIASNAERSGSMLMIGLIDIDNFKQINDFQGHPEGDRILREVAATLNMAVRSGDIVGRLGGDEFILIMQTKSQDPISIMERIEELFPPAGGYTISMGIAILKIDGYDWDECYKAADQRMLKRKFSKKLQKR